MRNHMPALIVASAFGASLLCTTAAFATPTDPTGEWRVANGDANIKIELCNGVAWGVVAWEKRSGGMDIHNPDRTQRDRPTFGMPVILGMRPSGSRWEGRIYNSQDGKIYDASIAVGANATVLHVEGCVLGFLCGGEDWSRVPPPPTTPVASAATAPKSHAAPAKAGLSSAGLDAHAAADVCSASTAR